jgi:hypothetical protein
MKHRTGIVWKKLLWPLVVVALLPLGVFLLGVYLVMRARDFRHIRKGVYPVGLDVDFGVWSRRRACQYAMFADAVDYYDFRRMTPAQQIRWKYERGWLIDPADRYPGAFLANSVNS